MSTEAERRARETILPGYRMSGSDRRVETSETTYRALLDALCAAGPLPVHGARESHEARPCLDPRELCGDRKVFGVWLNLYSLRGEPDFGIGNLTHLGKVVDCVAAAGGHFVGLSPLHALRNLDHEVSPYGPQSRLFRNPIYLDPCAIPEWKEAPAAQRLLDAPETRRRLAALSKSPGIDYAGVSALQRPLLEALHARFEQLHGAGDTERGREHAAFVRRGGTWLRDYATFTALEESLAERGHARDWRTWPAELRDPASPEVVAYRDREKRRVAFHTFLQMELDRQLADVQARARRQGMRLGLYQDLAVGSIASSFDAWAFPKLFVHAASLGAPPDPYAAGGQDWSLPPLHPLRLAAGELDYVDALLRANLSHSGALRIDHVMGLFRQFWIPRGRPASEGAYVRFPASTLLARVARESREHQALVIGEDLGTLPPELPLRLARSGILSTRVLLFEQRRGRFKSARDYSARALVTATTHDLPPLAGYWSGRDLEVQRRIGWIDDAALARAQTERAATRRALVARLRRDEGLDVGAPSDAELCRAAYTFLSRSPAPLLGVSLDDLAGESEPVNVPGVSQQQHPSWTRRMQRPVETLTSDPELLRTLEAVATSRLVGAVKSRGRS